MCPLQQDIYIYMYGLYGLWNLTHSVDCYTTYRKKPLCFLVVFALNMKQECLYTQLHTKRHKRSSKQPEVLIIQKRQPVYQCAKTMQMCSYKYNEIKYIIFCCVFLQWRSIITRYLEIQPSVILGTKDHLAPSLISENNYLFDTIFESSVVTFIHLCFAWILSC